MRRRTGAGLLILTLLLLGLMLPAAALTTNAADDFSSGGYSGSTGSVGWNGAWSEIGESNGPDSGAVQVGSGSTCASGPCLKVETLLGGADDPGASRKVDLTSATTADLEYHLDFPGGLLISGSVLVEASLDGGGWNRIGTHSAGSEGTFGGSLPVGGIVAIRFVTSGLSIGATAGVDDVVVAITSPDPTTTTTTTMTSTSTTTSPSQTTTTNPSNQETTTTAREGDTITNLPRPDTPTTSTTVPRSDSDTPDLTDTTPPSDTSPPSTGEEVADGPPPSQTSGVITGLDPGLAPRFGQPDASPSAQSGLLVRFLILAEDVRLDLLPNAVLGVFLTWISLKGIDRRG